MENWKNIKGYEGLYKVSSKGRVKSIPRQVKTRGVGFRITPEIILKPKNDLYERVCLYKNKRGKYVSVHRLVAEAFIPNIKNKPCVNHINGIKRDNRIENLEWCTHSENTQHAFDKLGRKNPRRLLKESDIPKIKKLYSDGLLQREIGEIFGIKRNTISRILRGISYGLN